MAGEWVTLDLSAAIFFSNGSGVPYGKYDGTGIVTNIGAPDFVFPGLVLDPATYYDLEVTYEDNDSGVSFYVYGLAGTTQSDYDTAAWHPFYDGEAYTGALTSYYAIGPGIDQWDANVAGGYMVPMFDSSRWERLISLRIREADAPEPPEDITDRPGVAVELAAGQARNFAITSPISGNLVVWTRDPGATFTAGNPSAGFSDTGYDFVSGHETPERPGPGKTLTIPVSVGDVVTVQLSAVVAGTHELRWQTLEAGLGEYVSASPLTDVQPYTGYDYGIAYGYEIEGAGSGASTSEAVAAAQANMRENIAAGGAVNLRTSWHGIFEAEIAFNATKIRTTDYSSWRIAPEGLPTVPDGLTAEEIWTGPSILTGVDVTLDPDVVPVIVHGNNGSYSFQLAFRLGFADPAFQPVAGSGTTYGGSVYGTVLEAPVAVSATIHNGAVTASGVGGSVANWSALVGEDGYVRAVGYAVDPFPDVPVPPESDFSNSVSASLNFAALVFTFNIEQANYLRYRYLLEPLVPSRRRRIVSRPLRQHPRSDGLGMSSVRRIDANRSTQASLRRAGGTYF